LKTKLSNYLKWIPINPIHFFLNLIPTFSKGRRRNRKGIYSNPIITLIKKRGFKVFIISAILLLFLDFCFPFRVPNDYSTVVLDKNNRILSSYLNQEDKWRFKCQASEVSPFFIKAILEKEDQYFYFHPGVNPFAMARAAFDNVTKQKRVSGASTINMQVVRLIKPQKRTYFNKIKEIIWAFQLELHHSKKEILSLYLNLIPLGSNIEGIKAASYIYLDKHPSKLSLAEAMTLCLIPNKPSLLNNSNKTAELQSFKKKWLDYFEKKELFPVAEINFARSEQVSLIRKNLRKIAPHFCERLKNETDASPYIFSTLNTNLQLQVESQINNYLARLRSIGLRNAMAMVVDNRTMEVLAYCGSGDYANKTDGGQVDGLQAVRSPGSTLKPYLYALAMEKGIINPKAILYDIPSDFGGFKPENFNNQYLGQVSMRDALQQSLNIPAVKTLEKYNLNEFLLELKKAKFKSVIENESKLGLSVILGGCGVTMEEMVKLYATFANKGLYQELAFRRNLLKSKSFFAGNSSEKLSLINPASAYIISDILSGVQRPDFPNNFEFTFKLPKIAWKTGTSFGKRDAWAIGYNPNYTVGVWLGNFSGESIPDLSGASVATPLLFQIFNTVETKKKWFQMPQNLEYRNVCSVSGLPKNTFCTSTQIDHFVSSVFYKNKCQHLKSIWTNPAETFRYCDKCLDRSIAVKKNQINYPSEYLEFLGASGMAHDRILPHNPSCQYISKSQTLSILSPRNGSIYYIESSNPQQMQLKANAGNNTNYLFWYHNNKLLGKYKAAESVFIFPTIGNNLVSCTDEFGKSVKISFEAKGL
jgi:penicillin-binding protein 1C